MTTRINITPFSPFAADNGLTTVSKTCNGLKKRLHICLVDML
jgi:hypothetical protein